MINPKYKLPDCLSLTSFLFLFLIGANCQSQTRYVDSLFSASIKTTYTYAEKDGEALLLDVYQPKGDKEKSRAALIWMHGGGFAGGKRDQDDEVKLMEMAAARGYVAVSISYRLTMKDKAFSCDGSRQEKVNTFREGAFDLWDAIGYMHKNAEQFGINPRQIVVGGSSAGAESVLNALYMKNWLYEGVGPYEDITPMAIFSLAGAMLDARYIVSGNAIPAVLFHGTKDDLVPYASAAHHYCEPTTTGYIWLDGSRIVADRLKALDSSYLLVTIEEGGHEVANLPFERMPMVFSFFHGLIQSGLQVQQEYWFPKS